MNPLRSLLYVCTSLFVLFSTSQCETFNLLRLVRKCLDRNPTQLYCGTYPDNCLANAAAAPDNITDCKLITTIERFEPQCERLDVKNAYINILCNRQTVTYLFTLLRQINHDPLRRSCSDAVSRSRAVSCQKLEFVALSLTSNQSLSTGQSLENLTFWVCAADAPHVTSWIYKNSQSQRLEKQFLTLPIDDFKRHVYPSSGLGVHWENLPTKITSDASWLDFSCQFVLSWHEDDIPFNRTSVDVGGPQYLQTPLYLKMIQGWVNRTRAESMFSGEIDDVVLANRTLPPIEPTHPLRESFFLAEPLVNPVNFSSLETTRILKNHSDHAVLQSWVDRNLHRRLWGPLFRRCRSSPTRSFCYVYDKEDPTCNRLESEECNMIVEFVYENDFTKLRIRMVVEDYHWGGVAFSKDRFMGDDLAYICYSKDDKVQMTTQILRKHSTYIGNDTRLANVLQVIQTARKESDLKMYCEFVIPTDFEIHQGPHFAEDSIQLELGNGTMDYYVFIAGGSTTQQRISYHAFQDVMNPKFSKAVYKEKVKGCGANKSNLLFRVLLIWLFFQRYIVQNLT